MLHHSAASKVPSLLMHFACLHAPASSDMSAWQCRPLYAKRNFCIIWIMPVHRLEACQVRMSCQDRTKHLCMPTSVRLNVPNLGSGHVRSSFLAVNTICSIVQCMLRKNDRAYSIIQDTENVLCADLFYGVGHDCQD